MTRFKILVLMMAGLTAGCQRVYYNTMEALGHPKRQILVSRVREARDSQDQAKEQFQSALEQFRGVVNFRGGLLEDKYNQLKAQYETSKARADTVNRRIAAVRDVAEALFAEWNQELDQYTNEQLRAVSRVKLEETQAAYGKLIAKMDRASEKMEPVLKSLYDQVLFLKHNLNAQAVVSLREELVWVEQNTEELVTEMEAAIAEANAFIGTLSEEESP